MKLTEEDYEMILESLDRMEAFLKSFLGGLDEENKRLEMELEPVISRATGAIHAWYFSTGNRVGKYDVVCDINPDPEGNPNPKPWELVPVESPKRGTLRIIEFYRRKGARVLSTSTVLGHIVPRERY
ncbi:MAG: hypothetical protein GY800_07915 [Planctomycetes bacterium]|nr:hypothetical protein [Planctomycetota bacterium]